VRWIVQERAGGDRQTACTCFCQVDEGFSGCKNYRTGPGGRAFYGVGLQPFACWDCGFESGREHGCVSLAIVVCCQVEVIAPARSPFQRIPTERVCVMKCD